MKIDLQEVVNQINIDAKNRAGKEYNLGLLIEDLKTLGDFDLPVIIQNNHLGYFYHITNIESDKELEREGKRKEDDVFISWRGSYYNLCLCYETVASKSDLLNKSTVTSRQFLKYCENADGKTYEGYKGGDFKMDKNTPIYISQYGECDFIKGSTIVSIESNWKVSGIRISDCKNYIEILSTLCSEYSNKEDIINLFNQLIK